MKISKLYSLIASLVSIGFFSSFTYAGTSSGGGGGWKYYYTTSEHLKHLKSFVANSIRETSVDDLNEVASNYKVQINWSEFADIIEKTKGSSSQAPIPGVNPNGDDDEKIMTYDSTKREIYALKGFFELFHKDELQAKEVRELMRLLIHEASHLFGIGAPEDRNSKLFSNAVLKLIINKWYRCNQPIPNNEEYFSRVAKCEYNISDNKTDTAKPTGLIFRIYSLPDSSRVSTMDAVYYATFDQWRLDDTLALRLVKRGISVGPSSKMLFPDIKEGDLIVFSGTGGEKHRLILTTIENQEQLIVNEVYKESHGFLKSTLIIKDRYQIQSW